VHTRQDLGQRAVHVVVHGLEPELTLGAELEPRMCLPRDVRELGLQLGVWPGPSRIPQREVAEHSSELARSNERAGIDEGRIREEVARTQPLGERLRGRDVVDAPHRDLGVHEVLDQIERRGRGRAIGRLEAEWDLNH
jgi:hypothetical protein